MEYTRCTTLGTNLLQSAILIYLAHREHGNEGIIHRPKDESEFLAKKRTFEANIFQVLFNPLTPASNCLRPTPDFLEVVQNILEQAKAQE